ncbi:MAG: ABC transporter permease [Gammaproteobacteria bacterium]
MPPALPFEWLLALRFLREGRAQTLLILTGITLGVGVIVFLTALINGLQANIIQRTLGVQAHISVQAPEDRVQPAFVRGDDDMPWLSRVEPRAQKLRSIPRWQEVAAGIGNVPGVRHVSAMVSGPVFAMRGDAEKQVALMGVELDDYLRIVPLDTYLVAGTLRVAAGEAVIGVELARELGLSVGDRLRLGGIGTRSETFLVSGLVSVGLRDLDRRWVFVSRRNAQNLLDLDGGVTHIDVRVDDIWGASAVADIIGARYDVVAESWMQSNRQLMTGLNSQRASSSIIRFFVLVSVAFGIASVLAVSVVQKQREIGILRAMGTRRATILQVFLIQGALLGGAGSVLGAAAGAALATGFRQVALNADGTPLFPIVIDGSLFLTAVLTATITGLVAAALPARRAARLDPVEAIRNG